MNARSYLGRMWEVLRWLLTNKHVSLLRRFPFPHLILAATTVFLVACSNSPPVPKPQTVVTLEDTPVQIELSHEGSRDAIRSYEIEVRPSLGELSGTPPSLEYTPYQDSYGADSFSFSVIDETGTKSKPASVDITVQPLNDPPTAQPLSIEVLEDDTGGTQPIGSDIDGNIVRFEISTPPNHGTVSNNLSGFTYTPDPNFNGNDSFRYVSVDNEEAKSEPAVVSVEVQSVNDLPLAHPMNIAVKEDTPRTIELSGSDLESSSLDFQISVSPRLGTISGQHPRVTYTPRANVHGSDSFQYAVVDSQGAVSESALVAIEIESVNDKPLAIGQDIRVKEDETVSVELSGKDQDGQVVSHDIVSFPENGSIAGKGAMKTYTPRPDFHGSDSFQFIVTDEFGLVSEAATINIVVDPSNDRPTAKSMQLFTAEDIHGLDIQLSGSDTDGQVVSFEVFQSPRRGKLYKYGSTWQYRPDPNFHGEDGFEYVAVDDMGLRSYPASVTIDVVDRPDPPSISTRRSHYFTTVGETIDLFVRVSDPDGDARSYQVRQRREGNGRFFPSSGSIRELNRLQFQATKRGTYTYRISVEDDTGLEDSTTVTIQVRNSPPLFDEPRPHYNKKEGTVAFTLRARDPDGQIDHFVIETIDGRSAKKIVIDRDGPIDVEESEPFSTGGDCETEIDKSCIFRVTYTPDEIDGHSRRIRFYAVDDEGAVSRKDFIRIETRELR